MSYVLLGSLIAILIIALYGLAHNEWVYRARMSVLDDLPPSEFAKLPAYSEMLKRWWCWNIDSYLESDNG